MPLITLQTDGSAARAGTPVNPLTFPGPVTGVLIINGSAFRSATATTGNIGINVELNGKILASGGFVPPNPPPPALKFYADNPNVHMTFPQYLFPLDATNTAANNTLTFAPFDGNTEIDAEDDFTFWVLPFTGPPGPQGPPGPVGPEGPMGPSGE
jgi:hypothetical protein